VKFEWNRRKSQLNRAKPGFSFDEAATVFGDPLATTAVDSRFLDEELHFVTFGHSAGQQLIVVAHVDRGGLVRIVSARTASRRERRSYEAGQEGRR
jgi:uncharacterized DUF497 family protein